MKKFYRVVLINKETKERRMLYERFTSEKKAREAATNFCLVTKNADFEIKQL